MEDPGTVILAAVSAAAAGASAIVAWFARADSIKSAETAEKAQEAALEAWRDAAKALNSSNEIAVKLDAERTSRELRAHRTAIGSLLRMWYMREAARRVRDDEPSAEHREAYGRMRAEVSASIEPSAQNLVWLIDQTVESQPSGDVAASLTTTDRVQELVSAWVEDPEEFERAFASEVTPEAIHADMERLKARWAQKYGDAPPTA